MKLDAVPGLVSAEGPCRSVGDVPTPYTVVCDKRRRMGTEGNEWSSTAGSPQGKHRPRLRNAASRTGGDLRESESCGETSRQRGSRETQQLCRVWEQRKGRRQGGELSSQRSGSFQPQTGGTRRGSGRIASQCISALGSTRQAVHNFW